MPFYVTFHGGPIVSGGNIPDPQQVVASYTPGTGGWTINNNVFNLPDASGTCNELRDIQLGADGNFYVVNAYKNSSVIWQIPPGGVAKGGEPTIFTQGAVPPCRPVTSGPTAVESLYHPFGFAFSAAMDVCYISNQDDNVVVAVYGPKAREAGGFGRAAARESMAAKKLQGHLSAGDLRAQPEGISCAVFAVRNGPAAQRSGGPGRARLFSRHRSALQFRAWSRTAGNYALRGR